MLKHEREDKKMTETRQEMIRRVSAKEIKWVESRAARFEFLRLDSEKGVGAGGYAGNLAVAVFKDRETSEEFGTLQFITVSGEVWTSQTLNAMKLEHDPPILPMPTFKSAGTFLGFKKKSRGEWMSGYYA